MRLPSKTTTFALLMSLSALTALVLPRSWTEPLRGPFQLLGLVQWAASQPARTVARVITRPPATNDEEIERLRRMVVAQQGRIEQLVETVREISTLQSVLPDSHAGVILAPVIGLDADPRRETLRISLPQKTGELVKPGQWVVAGLRETPSRALLGQRWLIGRVRSVQLQTARVVLATDPSFETEVQLAQATDTEQYVATPRCVLEGLGRGQMIIRQAPEDFYSAGYRVAVVPVSRSLPLFLSIGEVVSSARRDDSPMHYDLRVEPWSPSERLTHVYVLVTDAP